VVCELLGDGASLSTVYEEGEPVNAAGSGATTLAFRATTLGASRSVSYFQDAQPESTRKNQAFIEAAHALKQDEKLATSAKSSTNMAWNPGSRLLSHERAQNYSQSIILALKGENEPNTATEDLSSLTEEEPDANKQEKPKEPKHSTDANIEFIGSSIPKPSSDINKVGMKALISYPVVASMVHSPKNTRFNMKLKKLIAEHPDQEKLKSKKVKLEALGYEMD
nr:hypothetical protein [Tanacetum cinerariifolium]